MKNNGKTTAGRRAVAEQQAPSASSIVAAAMIRRSSPSPPPPHPHRKPPHAPSSTSSKHAPKQGTSGGGGGGGAGGSGGGGLGGTGGGSRHKGGGRRKAGGGVSAPLQHLARVSSDAGGGDDSDSDRDVSGAVGGAGRFFMADLGEGGKGTLLHRTNDTHGRNHICHPSCHMFPPTLFGPARLGGKGGNLLFPRCRLPIIHDSAGLPLRKSTLAPRFRGWYRLSVGSSLARREGPAPSATQRCQRRTRKRACCCARVTCVLCVCACVLISLGLSRALPRRKQVPWAVIKVRSETEIIRCLDPRFFVEGIHICAMYPYLVLRTCLCKTQVVGRDDAVVMRF